MLVCNNLKHTYAGSKELNFPDWEVRQGDHSLILGPSGCGKTSLLHLLSGLLKPKPESVFIKNTDIGGLNQSQLDKFRGQHIGFVFQKPHLVASLTVNENIELSSFLAKRPIQKTHVYEILKSLDIEDLAQKNIYQISQGQAQRVAIARAVITQPELIFCDEPTASLDDASCEAVIDLLKNQAEACGATLIIATHDQRVKDEFSNQLVL